MKNICAFVLVAIFCYQIFDTECNILPQAIQIITRKNNVFQLQLGDLKRILENDVIKDRYVVVVSIAGAFRKGKSFLMNIFIKYLNANYKGRHISDWLGENGEGSIAGGFSWRGGQKPETMGIWMWSEVFTHDSENGDKLAIVLIDTQGIFDDKTGFEDCTKIFAISTMLSSVQCFNIMQHIQEDHLQQLEFFTEYGRIAQMQKSAKPFQKLLFIVRDWPYSHETNYGNGQALIDEILTPTEDQALEMQELRKRIKSSFQSTEAYLLPHPGRIVAEGDEFTGDVQQIDPKFRKYVKNLVISLFAPENLIVKRINSQKMRAQDLVQYFETYLNIFKGDSLPKPKTIIEANIDASNTILQKECHNYYIKTMDKKLEERDLSATELIDLHKQTKSEAISQFLEKPKLGSDDHASTFKSKLEYDIEETYQRIEKDNLQKLKFHIEQEEHKRKNRKLEKDIEDMRRKKNTGGLKIAYTIIGTGGGLLLTYFAGPLSPFVGGIAGFIADRLRSNNDSE
ncbi:atlastin-like [Contarinia nasturtii]|uniref:atlastin-like n=1 Tax=Contarinia nasturtii TaxID=265458 RepID=UPI0012D44520|nr:atlastin-like [Contarinia nasturtii]